MKTVEGWAADFDFRGRLTVVKGDFRKIFAHQYILLNPDIDQFRTLVKYRELHPHIYYTHVYGTMDEAMNALSERYLISIADAQHDITRWTEKTLAVRKAQGEINGSEDS
jgi:hypothetical protein